MVSDQNKIAVIGMACRFPGANNPGEFWDNLVNGRDTIKHFSDEELAPFEFDFESLKNNPRYVRARGILSGVDMFDADFFGMTPREATLTDPQHRVWLEIAWEALENAGCDPFTTNCGIGVFAGSYLNTYVLNNILRDKSRLENYVRLRSTDSFQILTGNDASFIPTKTAYKFNLRGPAVNIQTACSTSLVAISQACQSLFSFESDICIAGGIAILIPQESGYIFQEGAIPSPDGKCRPFDAEGGGTVFSNGAGVVVLKRMEDAIRDKDTIYAGIRGWALNNDGSNKVSYMAPGIGGQSDVIKMAQSFSGIHPEDIGYIEAHGTATQLGDPIELSALNKVFREETDKKQFCGIGSVKSNIGHTDAAAGVASFIKAALSVYYKKIPPSLNYTKPNPHFDFGNSPFYVQDKLKNWEKPEPLIIGISSFGIGGTNAHVIIEEPPKVAEIKSEKSQWPDILPLSAKSEAALLAKEDDLVDYLEKNRHLQLQDIAYTLQKGRHHMEYRTFAVIEKTAELGRTAFFPPLRANEHLSATAFMFSGQGAQYTGMGKDLYKNNDTFRLILDECFEIVRSESGNDLKKILYTSPGNEEYEKRLASTDVTQPALFIIEYALARIYQDMGIDPAYLIGHSIGEYSAACISGVFDLHTALKIVVKRGMLMSRMTKGKMMAVRCSMEKLERLGGGEFEIAADNSDSQCTISFRTENEEAVRSLLDQNGLKYMPLNTSHAFHSSAFDPVLEEFSKYVDNYNLKPPQIPFISCLTGDFITPVQAVSGTYWAQQLRNTVRFRKGLASIAAGRDVLFLEIGPGNHLAGLARQNSGIVNKEAVLVSLGKRDEIREQHKIMHSVGAIWANGITTSFEKLHFGRNSVKIPLPTYPFQRKRHWIDYFPEKNQLIPSSDSSSAIKEEGLSKDKNVSPGIRGELQNLLSEISGYPSGHIKEDTSFEKMGFDSLFLTQFARAIEKKFGVKIEFRQLISDYPNIRVLGRFIESRLQYPGNSAVLKPGKNGTINNLVKFRTQGSRDPLIILHGQNADTFIPEYLGADYPYYGFLHPGSDGESLNFRSVGEMAEAYLDQLLKNKPEGPYYLGGFSFGGVLAFEMAVRLTGMGHKVPLVILFDSFACREPFRWRKSLLRIIKSNIIVPPIMKIRALVKRAICEAYILAERPTPEKLRPFYIINKYDRLLKTYKPGRFTGKTVLFLATGNGSSLRNLGWDGHVENLEVIPLNAGHLTIFKYPDCVRKIQTEIKRLLEES